VNRPALSSGTPEPEPSALIRFKRWVVPAERPGTIGWKTAVIGDVLDASGPKWCPVRVLWRANRGEAGMTTKPCGKRYCPDCVITWLCKYVAPAWAYWTTPVRVERFDSARAWEWAREKCGIKMTRDNAWAGVLVLPGEGDVRVAFTPDPGGVRGKQLDQMLLAAVRAVPVVDEGTDPRLGRDTDGATVPRKVPTDTVRNLAEAVGATMKGGERRFQGEMTLQQFVAWKDLVRSARN
jgi:hypothetical protein